MKTLSLELSKRLNEWWYLDNIETEYFYWERVNCICYWCEDGESVISLHKTENIVMNNLDIKTLTLEEVIEFLPKEIVLKWEWYLCMWKNWVEYCTFEPSEFINREEWETLLIAIEKMLTYLLDNNLLNDRH